MATRKRFYFNAGYTRQMLVLEKRGGQNPFANGFGEWQKEAAIFHKNFFI
jgi:hypothetical protein